MPFLRIHWSDETVDHLAQHDVTPEDFEEAFDDASREFVSASSGLPARIGYDLRGRRLFLSYIWIDDVEIEPVTAFEIGE